MKDKFSTTDMALVVSLACYGFSGPRLVVQDKYRVSFCYDNSEKLGEIVELFYRKKLKVDPVTYEDNRKHIKTRIYHFKQQQDEKTIF